MGLIELVTLDLSTPNVTEENQMDLNNMPRIKTICCNCKGPVFDGKKTGPIQRPGGYSKKDS